MKSVYGKAIQGARDYQEDSFAINEQDPDRPNSVVLVTLCDGMGGHAGGEVASATATDAFTRTFLASTETDAKARLGHALDASNKAVAEKIRDNPKLQGMGCTLVGALKTQNRLVWISVGDSHVYRYRAGKLDKLNADHSLLGELKEMVQRGEITKKEALSNPRRNALRSAVLGKQISLIDANASPLEEGDLLVFASDGLDTLAHEDLRALLERHYGSAPEDIVHHVLDAVANVQKPNQDNTSVVACYHTAQDHGFWSDTTVWDATPVSPSPKPKVSLVAGLTAALIVAVVALVVVLVRPEPEPEPVTVTPVETDQPGEIGRDEVTIDGAVTDPPQIIGADPEEQDGGAETNDAKNGEGSPEGETAPDEATDGGAEADAAEPVDPPAQTEDAEEAAPEEAAPAEPTEAEASDPSGEQSN